MDEELVSEFIIESLEHVEEVEPVLLKMEAEGNPTKDDWNEVFRAVHSMKGAAGFLGLDEIQHLSHVSENLLMLLRDGDMEFDPEMISPLLDVIDSLRQMLEALPASRISASQELIESITSYLDSKPAASSATPAESSGPRTFVLTEPPTGWDIGEVQSKLTTIGEASVEATENSEVLRILCDGTLEELAACAGIPESNVEIFEPWGSDGMPLSPPQPSESLRFGGVAAELGLLASDQVAELLEKQAKSETRVSLGRLAIEAGYLTPDQVDRVRNEQILRAALAEAEAARQIKETTAEVAEEEKQARRGSKSVTETIRVSVPLLNKLINLAGELVLSRNQLRQILDGVELSGLKRILQSVDHVTTEIQESILYTRMQPLRVLFDKLPRQIRDAAKKLGKTVNYDVSGSEVELDRTLIESLADPMTHMVRNAVDHGMESPEVRTAAGKSDTGTIEIRAYHESGQVLIEIGDDGGGIDPDRTRKAAVDKGVMTKEQAEALTDKEAVNLIFHPGLSTAKKVTEVSGRGVGMDVVRTNINALGGQVEVESTLGEGTLLRVRLPLTLAIIPSLTVSVGDQRFAIPQVNLEEVVLLRAEEMAKRLDCVQGVEVMHLRDQLLPLVRLSGTLGIDSSEASSRCYVVVLRAGPSLYGLVVDELHDSEEIVVKPLSGILASCYWYAGSTILGDGKVAMILEVQGLAQRAGLDLKDIGEMIGRDNVSIAERKSSRLRSMIVVTNGTEEFLALPQEQIQRLERIRLSDIRRVGHREFINLRGQVLPLIRPEDVLPLQPAMPDNDEAFLLIPRSTEWEAGVLISKIVDTVEPDVEPEAGEIHGPGLLGSAILDDKLTLFIDMEGLLEGSGVERRASHS